jgi:hypothetical protein
MFSIAQPTRDIFIGAKPKEKRVSPLQHLLARGAAGCVEGSVCQPLKTTKTRLGELCAVGELSEGSGVLLFNGRRIYAGKCGVATGRV